ncbi:MAG: hypothetical protein ABC596_09160 [Candidatus Methanosuratincola petrocarbonis]
MTESVTTPNETNGLPPPPTRGIMHEPLTSTPEDFITLTQKYGRDPTPREELTRIVRAAHQFGYIKLGWNLYDYLIAAVRGIEGDPMPKAGFEDVIIWGKQGTGKSNLAMQLMFILYQDWDWVLKRVILTPQEVLSLYKETKAMTGRIPIVELDDITTIFPKQLWFMSKDMYIALQQFIATVRMRFCNILVSTPLPQNVVSSLKENASFEVVVYPATSYMVERYAWLTDLKRPCVATLKKIYTEYSTFDIFNVPGDVWKEYEDKRWEVTEGIVRKMEENLKKMEEDMQARENEDEADEPPDPEKYLHISTVMRDMSWTPLKARRELRKGYMRYIRYQGTYYVLREDFEKVMGTFLGVK